MKYEGFAERHRDLARSLFSLHIKTRWVKDILLAPDDLDEVSTQPEVNCPWPDCRFYPRHDDQTVLKRTLLKGDTKIGRAEGRHGSIQSSRTRAISRAFNANELNALSATALPRDFGSSPSASIWTSQHERRIAHGDAPPEVVCAGGTPI
jgi:hypothetical protein